MNIEPEVIEDQMGSMQGDVRKIPLDRMERWRWRGGRDE